MKQEYIETPYGRKTPELLCKAMDALVVHDDLVTALERLLSLNATQGVSDVDYEAAIAEADAALAKAKGEA